MLADLIRRNRSYRRFQEEYPITVETLRGLIELARLSASAGNLQPLKFVPSCDDKRNSTIFQCLRWAAYLTDWAGPEKGERPSAYVIILGDKEISKLFGCDHGIAAQSILLGAAELGLGGCMIASIDREELHESLGIPHRFEVLLVIALGKPKETVRIEEVGASGEVRYWRDKDGVHHVPKRSIDELILPL